MLTAEHDGDPFDVIMDAHIHTPADAALWLQFFAGIRGLLAGPAGYPTNLEVQTYISDESAEDPHWWDFIDAYRELASDPERRAHAVCAIDLWAIRARLEWGLV